MISEALEARGQLIFDNYLNAVERYLIGSWNLTHEHEVKIPLKDTVELELFRRTIEDFADVPEQMADDFRRMVACFCFVAQRGNRPMTWKDHPVLRKAITGFLDLNPDYVLPNTGKRRTIDDDWKPS